MRFSSTFLVCEMTKFISRVLSLIICSLCGLDLAYAGSSYSLDGRIYYRQVSNGSDQLANLSDDGAKLEDITLNKLNLILDSSFEKFSSRVGIEADNSNLQTSDQSGADSVLDIEYFFVSTKILNNMFQFTLGRQYDLTGGSIGFSYLGDNYLAQTTEAIDLSYNLPYGKVSLITGMVPREYLVDYVDENGDTVGETVKTARFLSSLLNGVRFDMNYYGVGILLSYHRRNTGKYTAADTGDLILEDVKQEFIAGGLYFEMFSLYLSFEYLSRSESEAFPGQGENFYYDQIGQIGGAFFGVTTVLSYSHENHEFEDISLLDRRAQIELFFEYTEGFDWYASYQYFQNEEYNTVSDQVVDIDNEELRLGIRVLITKDL